MHGFDKKLEIAQHVLPLFCGNGFKDHFAACVILPFEVIEGHLTLPVSIEGKQLKLAFEPDENTGAAKEIEGHISFQAMSCSRIIIDYSGK